MDFARSMRHSPTTSDISYNDGTWHETNANIFNKNTNTKFNVMNDAAVTGAYHVWAAWPTTTTAV